MNAAEYYESIRIQSNTVFDASIKDLEALGQITDIKSNLTVWQNLTHQWKSSKMLCNALEELDISCSHLLLGFYRSSFKSLRLALEMICGSLYFSAFDLEYTEWELGSKDLIWSRLLCSENGIFSTRFNNAYFPELREDTEQFQTLTKTLYRTLSEMVHGNYNTWNTEDPKIELNTQLKTQHKESVEKLSKILNFGFSLKYLKQFSGEEKEKIESYINASIGYIENIRKEIGGPIDE